MNRSAFSLLAALLCLSVPPLRAQDAADAPPRVKAQEEKEVRALLGKKATVIGKVTDAFESEKAGMTFINLDGGAFTLVSWRNTYEKFGEGGPVKLYPKGKTLEVTGTITEYKGKSGSDAGKLQIKLNRPEQVKILDGDSEEKDDADAKEKPDKAPPEKPAEEPKPKPPAKEEPPAAKPDPAKPVDPKKYFK